MLRIKNSPNFPEIPIKKKGSSYFSIGRYLVIRVVNEWQYDNWWRLLSITVNVYSSPLLNKIRLINLQKKTFSMRFSFFRVKIKKKKENATPCNDPLIIGNYIVSFLMFKKENFRNIGRSYGVEIGEGERTLVRRFAFIISKKYRMFLNGNNGYIFFDSWKTRKRETWIYSYRKTRARRKRESRQGKGGKGGYRGGKVIRTTTRGLCSSFSLVIFFYLKFKIYGVPSFKVKQPFCTENLKPFLGHFGVISEALMGNPVFLWCLKPHSNPPLVPLLIVPLYTPPLHVMKMPDSANCKKLVDTFQLA